MSGFLEGHIQLFVALLRRQGLPIGSGEAVDAARAVQMVDLQNRSAVKTALRAVLVKRQADRDLFEQFFNVYFARPLLKERGPGQACRPMDANMNAARRELAFMGEHLALADEELSCYLSLPAASRARISAFVRRTEAAKNVDRQFRPVLEATVKGALRYWHRRALSEEIGAPAAGGAPGAAAARLIKQDMARIKDQDLARAREIVAAMARRLALKVSRRYRPSHSRRIIDLRRTMRANIALGGSPCRLRYKAVRRPKQRLLLLCDVSASMSRYALFTLQFIYGLRSALKNMELFFFADNLERVTSCLQSSLLLEKRIRELADSSRQWGGGTDLAPALQSLQTAYAAELHRATMMLVVSDTRTLHIDAAATALATVKRPLKELLWLNPLPLSQWPLYRSVGVFAQMSRMLACHTLSELEQALQQVQLN